MDIGHQAVDRVEPSARSDKNTGVAFERADTVFAGCAVNQHTFTLTVHSRHLEGNSQVHIQDYRKREAKDIGPCTRSGFIWCSSSLTTPQMV